jgi:hypothetical protein
MAGSKFDHEKIPLELLPYDSLQEIGKVLKFGRDKYGAYNWKEGIEYSRLIGAAMRHLGQFNDGVNNDSESLLNHAAHAACNLLFLIWMQKHKPEMDDRWKPKHESKKSKLTQPYKFNAFNDIISEIDRVAGHVLLNTKELPDIDFVIMSTNYKMLDGNNITNVSNFVTKTFYPGVEVKVNPDLANNEMVFGLYDKETRKV